MNHPNLALTTATPHDIPLIQSIARNTWPDTFGKILSGAQIAYMLDRMYNTEILTEQMQNPHYHYYLIGQNIGFAALELHYERSPISKIHKLYLLPVSQGNGWGKKTIAELEIISRDSGDHALILNVNINNPAIGFYEKCGFKKWKSEVIDIGHGYVMDDYVYRKDFILDLRF